MDQRRNGNKRASQEAASPTGQGFSNPKLGSEMRKSHRIHDGTGASVPEDCMGNSRLVMGGGGAGGQMILSATTGDREVGDAINNKEEETPVGQ